LFDWRSHSKAQDSYIGVLSSVTEDSFTRSKETQPARDAMKVNAMKSKRHDAFIAKYAMGASIVIRSWLVLLAHVQVRKKDFIEAKVTFMQCGP
jgi:hypothetical protein